MSFMDRARARLDKLAKERPVLKNVLILLTGTSLSQVFAIGVSIFTARIFSPEDFGRFALYGAITAVITTIASLRYDMTIVLPEDDDEARVVGRLATRLNIIFSITASLLALLLRNVIIDIWQDEVLATWLPFAGLTVFCVAQINVLQYWYNRKTQYGVIAKNRVQQTIGSSGGQLLLGLAGMRSMAGLLFGTLVGQIYAFLNLHRQSTEFRRQPGPDAPSMLEVAKTYKKMPMLNLPNAFIDSIRANGIAMIIGKIAVGSLGQFNLAWRVLHVPIGLINGAVSQVFYRELARVKPGNMRRLTRATIKRAAVLSFIPFAIIYIISPWLFIFVFGDQWDLAGDIARAITPWLAMQLITSPISTVFVVTSKQHWMLVFSIFFAAAPLAFLALSPLEFIDTMTVVGLIMAGMLIIMLVMADFAAGAYDRDGADQIRDDSDETKIVTELVSDEPKGEDESGVASKNETMPDDTAPEGIGKRHSDEPEGESKES